MALFHHLFGGRKERAKELIMDDEIMAELKQLKSKEALLELAANAVYNKLKKPHLLKLFRETPKVLRMELHLVKLIRKNPPSFPLYCLRYEDFKEYFAKKKWPHRDFLTGVQRHCRCANIWTRDLSMSSIGRNIAAKVSVERSISQ